jgi:hypothetical protein
MTPHLVKWQDKFKGRGFTVIEVDNGNIDELDDVKLHLEEIGINFPVLHDAGGEVCDRFAVSGYPTAFLVGRDGKVIWSGTGIDPKRIERKIEAAL